MLQRAMQGRGPAHSERTHQLADHGSLMEQVQAAYPGSKWIQWEPVNRDNVRAGSMLAFGQYVETRYNLEKADIILSLDGDFLSSGFPDFCITRGSSRRGAVPT